MLKQNAKKLRGGYYTPKEICEFLANWAIRSKEDKILEPSCGDGNIVKECVKRLYKISPRSKKSQILGIELDSFEATKARKRIKQIKCNGDIEIKSKDFFEFCAEEYFNSNTYDVVIGNPPFIRYQDFPDAQRERAFNLMRKVGLKPSKLTNSWLAFLACSTLLLNSDGRLAMVIPAELFQVNYAAEVRKYLSEFFKRIFIITFKKLVFTEVQQEIVLLLCERNGNSLEGINVFELENSKELADFNNFEILRKDIKPVDHTNDKWTQYFLSKEEILLLRDLSKHPDLMISGNLFDVDVGVVTGHNKYFVINSSDVNTYNLKNSFERIVARSNHLSGLSYTQKDFNEINDKDYYCYLFYPKDIELSEPIKAYIKLGEEQKVNKGYKCSARKPWYIVPSVWFPDAFMLRQVHRYPKIILNKAKATSTDTIHRVRFKNGFSKQLIAASFVNSLTFAFAEITGRSYGGGVLTFEPSECEKIPIPYNYNAQLDFKYLNKLIREDKIEEAQKITDEELLHKGLNFTYKQIYRVNSIWQKLMYRRINRRK